MLRTLRKEEKISIVKNKPITYALYLDCSSLTQDQWYKMPSNQRPEFNILKKEIGTGFFNDKHKSGTFSDQTEERFQVAFAKDFDSSFGEGEIVTHKIYADRGNRTNYSYNGGIHVHDPKTYRPKKQISVLKPLFELAFESALQHVDKYQHNKFETLYKSFGTFPVTFGVDVLVVAGVLKGWSDKVVRKISDYEQHLDDALTGQCSDPEDNTSYIMYVDILHNDFDDLLAVYTLSLNRPNAKITLVQHPRNDTEVEKVLCILSRVPNITIQPPDLR